jgi:hypothetical protein
MASKLYYDPAKPSVFATLKKLQEAARQTKLGKNSGELLPWLLTQDTYTLHRPVRRKLPRNPYTVNNLFDLWEIDLIDVQAFGIFNDNCKFLLTVIDVFSKYLHIVPLKSKTGTAVTSAFKSILENPKYSKPIQRQPIWVRTDKGKEFLNRHFQDMLKNKGIHFQVCLNPDVKCSIVERAQRTVRDKIYRYFACSN